ncbi:GH36-type glycosyl hydrolase domain-containing protein, partial [Verrucomicrobiota bacterium]
VPYDPVQSEPEGYEFSVGTTDIAWRFVRKGLAVDLRLLVPRRDPVELWSVTVKNLGRRTRPVSIYSYMPVGRIGPFTHHARFDSGLGGMIYRYFPYHTLPEQYYELTSRNNCVFCVPDIRPTSFELSRDAFTRLRGLERPGQLEARRLARGFAVLEAAAAVFQFCRRLAPGQPFTVHLLFGPARDRAHTARLKRRYLVSGGFEKAAREVQRFHRRHAPSVRIDTPDDNLNHYVNTFLAARTLFCVRTARLSSVAPARNVVTDALGGIYTDPDSARDRLLQVMAEQNSDGWLKHGMRLAQGVEPEGINTVPHRDMNVWAPFAFYTYMAETGDTAILDEKVPFVDSAQEATVYEHVRRGLEWLLADRTARKLSRLGLGDWNDPLNMAGCKGKGESVWLTQALIHALDTWAAVARFRGDSVFARRCRREAAACRGAVNRYAWDGQWYARGTSDNGQWFGVHRNKEGRIYLNPQAWAFISGTVTDPIRLRQCIMSVHKHLMTPSGPMMLAPAYTGMREEIGRLTLKAPGTYENGAVYCHAALFYAYGLFVVRQAEQAFHVLRLLLPGWKTHTLQRAQQLPVYIPNCYRGRDAGESAGRSSHEPNTGTSAWFYLTVVTRLLGVRAQFDGLRLDPQLPAAWRRAAVWRRFRGAEYEIEIRRSARVKATEVVLDGRRLAG